MRGCLYATYRYKNQQVTAGILNGKIGVKAKLSTEQTEGSTDKFNLVVCQVETKGTPEDPAWNFQVATGEPVLKGSLIKTKLATIEVIALGKPWSLEATFSTSLRDVEITAGEGLWSKSLFPENRESIDIFIAKELLKHKFLSPLSRVRLPYN